MNIDQFRVCFFSIRLRFVKQFKIDIYDSNLIKHTKIFISLIIYSYTICICVHVKSTANQQLVRYSQFQSINSRTTSLFDSLIKEN
jgi:hypothetical protein